MFKKDKINGYYNNTKIANEIRRLASSPKKAAEKYVEKEYSIRIDNRAVKSKKTEVTFWLSKALSITDCVILDAAAAFYAASQRGVKCAEFTSGDLAEFIYGSKKARRKDIGKELERLCDIEMKIYVEQEIAMRIDRIKNSKKTERSEKDAELDEYRNNIKKMDNFDRDHDGIRMCGKLLPLEKVKGAKRRRYRFYKAPMLYEYASVINKQYLCYPQRLLEELGGSEQDKATDSTLNVQRVLLERYYLIGRLAELNRSRTRKETSYDPAVIDIGSDDPDRDILYRLTWDKKKISEWSSSQLSHCRNEVFEELLKLLEHFKRAGVICGYSATEERGVRSVRIERDAKRSHFEPCQSCPIPETCAFRR